MKTNVPTHDDTGEVSPKESEAPRKLRKHGYRGYPNNPSVGGGVHMGSGFAGVGSTAFGETSLAGSSIIGNKTRESAREAAREEDQEDED